MVRKILKDDIHTSYRPFVIRLDVGDSHDPVILSKLAQLQTYLGKTDTVDQDAEFAAFGLKEQGWMSLRVLNALDQEVDLTSPHQSADGGFDSAVPVTGMPEPNLPFRPPVDRSAPTSILYTKTKASRLVQDFWSRVLTRGIDGMQAAIVSEIEDPKPIITELPEEGPKVIRRMDARKQVKAFYSAILKRALDRLQHSIGDDTLAETPTESRPAPIPGL
jgi:hypothetical protein